MAGTTSMKKSSRNDVISYDSFVNEFDSSKFTLTPPKVEKDGKIQFTVLYDGSRINLETPWFYLPFSPSRYSETSSYTLRLSDRPVRHEGVSDEEYEDEKERATSFFRNIGETLTDLLLDYGVEYSKQIFGGEEYERPVVKALFSNPVKYNEYGYSLNGKLRGSYEDQTVPNIEFFIQVPNGRYVKRSISSFEELIDSLPKSSRVKTIIFPSIWAVGGKFGISWNIRQILLKQRVQRSYGGFGFSDNLVETTEEEAGIESVDYVEDDGEEDGDYEEDSEEELELED